MNKAIFLDRDGVINKAIVKDGIPHSPNSLDELEFIPGIKHVLDKLKELGYLLFVVSNQPDIARKKQTKENIELISQYICDYLPIDKVYICPHDDEDDCDCRKPKPGMILKAQREFNIDLSKSWMIGDRWRDVNAGKNAGCKTIFIDYEYREGLVNTPDYFVDSVDEIIIIIGGHNED